MFKQPTIINLLRKTLHSRLLAAQTEPGTYEVLPEQPCKLFIWRHGFATLNGTAAAVAPTPKRTPSHYEESTRGKMLYSRNRPPGAGTSRERREGSF